MSRVLRLAAVTAVAAVAAVLAPSTATAAPIGQCSTTQGTIIAVDFGHWSGPIIRGCGVQANGQPDPDPYTLLHDGGFTTAGDAHDGPAFICRIGNAAFAGGTQYPTPSEDHCVVTPPASAYWAYWRAPAGATAWSYGSMTDHPGAGEVDLWTFGATSTNGAEGAPPASLIDQLRAHNTATGGGAPAPPVAGTPLRAATTTATPRHSSAPAPGSAVPSSAAAVTPTTATSSSPAPGTAGAGPTARPGRPRVVPAAATAAQHSSGSALPIVITAVIVAALGGAGGVSLLRRRRHERG